MELRVSRVLRAQLASPGRVVALDLQVLKDPLEALVFQANPDLQEVMVSQEHQEMLVWQVQLVPQVNLVKRVLPEILVLLGQMGSQETQDGPAVPE